MVQPAAFMSEFVIYDVSQAEIFDAIVQGVVDGVFATNPHAAIQKALAATKKALWSAVNHLNILRNVASSYYKLAGFDQQNILPLGTPGISIFMAALFLRTVLITAAIMNDNHDNLKQLENLAESLAQDLVRLKTLRKKLNENKLGWAGLEDRDRQLLLWLYAHDEQHTRLKQWFTDQSDWGAPSASEALFPLFINKFQPKQEVGESNDVYEKRKKDWSAQFEEQMRIVLQAAMRKRWETIFYGFMRLALIINTDVFALLAAFSVYALVKKIIVGVAGAAAFAGGGIIAAYVLGIVFFLVTVLVSWYMISGHINKDCAMFCDFWLHRKKFTPKHLLYAGLVVAAVAPSPLLLHVLCASLKVALAVVGVSNPIGLYVIAGALLAFTVVGSVYFLATTLRRIREEFCKKLGKGSSVYQKYEAQNRVWLYWTMVGLGSMFAGMVVLVGVLGDLFGARLVPILRYKSVLIAISILSFFCNLLQNVEMLHKFPETMQTLFLKKTNKVSPAESQEANTGRADPEDLRAKPPSSPSSFRLFGTPSSTSRSSDPDSPNSSHNAEKAPLLKAA